MADAADKNYEGVWDSRLGFGKTSPRSSLLTCCRAIRPKALRLYAPGVVECVKEMPELLEVARAKGVPIIHTPGTYTRRRNYHDGGVWIKKAPVLKDLVGRQPICGVL